MDYQETFSLVIKLNTIRVVLSLTVNFDWPLHQFDVKNTFFHDDLKEKVYINIPPCYMATLESKIVCKLQQALYELKQSHRVWSRRFILAMKKHGFQQSNSDHMLFLKHQQGKVIVLMVYVDDMIIIRENPK
jgi:hypothetical protein